MEIYVIKKQLDDHTEIEAHYSTKELAEKALKRLLEDVMPILRQHYYVECEYVDRFYLIGDL